MGSIYTTGGDKNNYHQQEKVLPFKNNIYNMPIREAKSEFYDSECLIDILHKFGDYVYIKDDHQADKDQYMKRTAKLELPYVTRKLLDFQHINMLTTYLEGLHKQGLATKDHNTLLIKCYANLNNTEKLKEFIMTKDHTMDFNVEIAIKICRQASSEDALLLAKKHGMHDCFLEIEIEDKRNYREALEYIITLDFEEAIANMKKYGFILIENVPDEATQFLKKLCLGYKPHNKARFDQSILGISTASWIDQANPEDFIHLFVNSSEKLVDFLEHLVKVRSKWNTMVYNTLIERYLHIWASQKDPMSKDQYENKVMQLLKNSEANYDKDHILVLCHTQSFKTGILYLYQESKSYQQILQYHLKQKEYKSALATCNLFGQQDPDLWVEALWSCVKDPNKPSSFMNEILCETEKKQLLSPLIVVDVLTDTSCATLGEYRDYLLNVLKCENEKIEKEQEIIDKYRKESERVRVQIKTLQTSTMIFQGLRCSVCRHELELPSIHFLCQHAYHQHCFQSFTEDNKCPTCLPKHEQILDMIKSQKQDPNLHETFHRQLEEAEDGFSLVADYFGYDVFNKLTGISNSPAAGIIHSNIGNKTAISNVVTYGPPAKSQQKLIALQNISIPSASGWGSIAPDSARPEMQVTSEVTMKLNECHPVHSSLEANLTSSSTSQVSPSPARKLTVSCSQPTKTQQSMPYRNKHQVRGYNPFEDDYDESKNPFAADESTNPFAENSDEEGDECYSGLNPFDS